MNKKDKELLNATVILSAVSVAITALAFLGIALIGTIVMVNVFEFQSLPYVAVIGIICTVGMAVKIVALVFAVKSKRENSRSYVLVAAILHSVSGLSGDFLSIAAAVCGYILYSNMGDEEVLTPQNITSENGDNIYGMK